jgi:hypothetical protein
VCTFAPGGSVARWGSSGGGAPADPALSTQRPEPRAVLLGRSAVAPVVLAFTTVAGFAGAVLALFPAALRRRPAGRAEPRAADEGAGAGGGAEAASEPIAR